MILLQKSATKNADSGTGSMYLNSHNTHNTQKLILNRLILKRKTIFILRF
jgi:hypothetical protein